MRLLKRTLPYLATLAVLMVIFSALGQAMAPQWRAEPYTDHIAVSERNTEVRARNMHPVQEGTYDVRTINTRVTLAEGVSVDAIIREPIGAPSGRPACLFIHGAGTGKAAEVYEDLSRSMATAGIVTLVPSKRLDTYTLTHRNYQNMAHDYEASLNVLRHQAGVDPAKAGLYAESEGTWISEAMAAIDPNIAFMILTSPPALSGRHQMAMAANSYLSLAGAPDGLKSTVDSILSMNLAPFGPDYADFPSEQYLHHLTMPLLINYGTEDPAMPIEQGAKLITETAKTAGNSNVTLRYYPANHQMRVGAKTSKPGLPLDSHYTRNLDDWTNCATAGTTTIQWSTPLIAGSQPHQEYAAPTSTRPGLITSINVLAAGIAAALVCFVLAIVLAICIGICKVIRALFSSRPRQRTPHKVPKRIAVPLTLTGVAALASLLEVFAYAGIAVSAAMKLTQDTATLHRGWVGLHVLALVDVLLLSWLLVALWRNHYYKQTSADHRGFTAAAFADDSAAADADKLTGTSSWGVARTSTMVLTLIAAVLTLLLLSFFGLFVW